MGTTKAVRTIPTLTEWSEAVDSVNYAKGTDVQVVKDGGKNPLNGNTYAHNEGAQPLFHYQNRKGNIGDWYAITDVTEVTKVVKAKNGPVTTTKGGFSPAQLAKIAKLQELGVL